MFILLLKNTVHFEIDVVKLIFHTYMRQINIK